MIQTTDKISFNLDPFKIMKRKYADWLILVFYLCYQRLLIFHTRLFEVTSIMIWADISKTEVE